MSNIYIQEPATNGKVTLKTTLGDIDVELWSREAPKACRNFVQLCMEGYYDKTIFHRVIKGFIAQGGDPTGTGFGGESIYGEPFKDELHSRLRFVRRGLLAMANSEKNSNGSQFFFTLGPCPELQDKHTIFGKVAGKTLYNMIKLNDLQVDQNERPLYPPKINSTEVVYNPFDDIAPRKKETKKIEIKEERPTVKGKKDFKLLSFGDEAEEDEEEVTEVIEKFKGKSKSSHDLLDDPKLSSIPAVDLSLNATKHKKIKGDIDDKMDGDDSDSEEENGMTKKRKIDKLSAIRTKLNNNNPFGEGTSKDFLDEPMEEDHENDKTSKLKSYKDEFKKLKKTMLKAREAAEISDVKKSKKAKSTNHEKKLVDKKDREKETLELFFKFQASKPEIFSHRLVCESEEPVVARDANLRNDAEWYSIDDPRNPINIRRREAGNLNTQSSSGKS